MSLCKKYIIIFSLSLYFTTSSYANSVCNSVKITDTQILAWSYEAMLLTYNNNFTITKNKENESKAKMYYTDNAWNQYTKSANESGNLNMINNKRLVVSVGLENSPVILNKSDKSWKVQLPLLINYQSSTERITIRELATIEVIETDDPQPEQQCLQIKNILFSPY